MHKRLRLLLLGTLLLCAFLVLGSGVSHVSAAPLIVASPNNTDYQDGYQYGEDLAKSAGCSQSGHRIAYQPGQSAYQKGIADGWNDYMIFNC